MGTSLSRSDGGPRAAAYRRDVNDKNHRHNEQRPHRFGAQGARLEVGSRCRLYSSCAPIVATPDAFADAGDATRLAGARFYRQRRVGLGGRQFMIWKFRTMKVSAETQTHERYYEELIRTNCAMTKLDANGDARLAPFGRILRASGLDELPQIFNVLAGEMSLVGPRPCLPRSRICKL